MDPPPPHLLSALNIDFLHMGKVGHVARHSAPYPVLPTALGLETVLTEANTVRTLSKHIKSTGQILSFSLDETNKKNYMASKL